MKRFVIFVMVAFMLLSSLGASYNVKRVQFDANYFLGNDGFYFVEENNSNRDFISSELDRLIQRLDDSLTIREEEPGPEPPVGFPVPIPTPEPEPWNETPIGLDADVYNLFNQKCASCHSGSKPKAQLALVDDDRGALANLSAPQRGLIFRLVNGKDLSETERRMPLGAPALSQSDIDLLESWWKTK